MCLFSLYRVQLLVIHQICNIHKPCRAYHQADLYLFRQTGQTPFQQGAEEEVELDHKSQRCLQCLDL